MRIVFDVDMDKDDLGDKLKQLKEIETAIEEKYSEVVEKRNNRARKEGEIWLSARMEKPF